MILISLLLFVVETRNPLRDPHTRYPPAYPLLTRTVTRGKYTRGYAGAGLNGLGYGLPPELPAGYPCYTLRIARLRSTEFNTSTVKQLFI